MMQRVLDKLGLGEGFFKDEGASRRRHARRTGVPAEVTVAHQTFSVHDWSMGGLFFESRPDSRIVVGDQLRFDMKFRLDGEVVTISHYGKVVRSVRRGIAAVFEPLPQEARRQFTRVIDRLHAESFVQSQVA